MSQKAEILTDENQAYWDGYLQAYWEGYLTPTKPREQQSEQRGQRRVRFPNLSFSEGAGRQA